MTGLEKIIAKIGEDARKEAERLRAEADRDARAIGENARREASEIEKEWERETEDRVRAYTEKVDSARALEKRNRILEAKQALIAEILDKSLETIRSMDDVSYFALLLRMAEQNIRPGEGLLQLSEKDKARMPADFITRMNELAAQKDGSLRLSDEVAPIRDGLKLLYGGIEQNCTLESIFATKKDKLADMVAACLFS